MDREMIATFSLVARDPENGHLGVAVASKFLAVGAVVPTAVADVGAVASQALANTGYGPRAMRLLQAGRTLEQVASEFRSQDEGFQERQFGMVAADGSSLSHTGDDCLPWAGSITGPGFAAQGNILSGPEVLDAMVAAFTTSQLDFPERLLAALQAGDEAGGDSRGRQSAALYVVGQGMGYGGLSDRWIDLRVDDHPLPVQELGRLLGMYRLILGKPSEPPQKLEATDIRWLQERLELPVTGNWDEATELGLKRLFGTENLEDRWLGGAQVDPQAWQHLRRLLGA